MSSSSRNFGRHERNSCGVLRGIQPWILSNEKLCSNLETALRIISYIVAGRNFAWSREFSELLYSASSLIGTLVNAVKNPDKFFKHLSDSRWCKSLKLLASTLDCVEVFFEVSVVGSKESKWTIISVIEAVKLSINMILLYVPNSVSLLIPSSRLNSKELTASPSGDATALSTTDTKADSQPNEFACTQTLKLKVRTLASASKMHTRTWKIPRMEDERKVAPERASEFAQNDVTRQLNVATIAAETIYICRPLIYLYTRYHYRSNSYKPWAAAFVSELVSLLLHDYGRHVNKCRGGSRNQLDQEEVQELRRRTIMLLVYLLRSPVYEHATEKHLMSAFVVVTSCVPGTHFVLKPLIDYLLQWQKLYFNCWAK